MGLTETRISVTDDPNLYPSLPKFRDCKAAQLLSLCQRMEYCMMAYWLGVRLGKRDSPPSS